MRASRGCSQPLRSSWKPKIKPKADKLPSTVTQQIYGGFLYLPKKADLTKDPVIRHEGPQGQLLKIDIAKQVDA